MTSSGRRVKRKNLDHCDGSLVRNQHSRKSRNGRKTKRKKSSSKSRPQRAAARNALHLFSRITGASTDGDVNGSDHNSSESESALQDSSFESEESDASLQNGWHENLKGKEVSLDHTIEADQPHPESHLIAGSRKRLILKLPNRDSSKFASQQNIGLKFDGQFTVASTSSRNFQKVGTSKYSEEDFHGGHVDLLGGCKDGSITWVGARTRTSKRLKIGESSSAGLFSGSVLVHDQQIQTENTANDHSTFTEEHSPEHPTSSIQHQEGSLEDIVCKKEISYGVGVPGSSERAEIVDRPLELHDGGASSSQCHEICNGTTMPSAAINGTENEFMLKENGVQTPTKLRIKSIALSRDNGNSPRKEIARDTAMPLENIGLENNLDLPVSADDRIDMPCSENKDQNGVLESDGLANGSSSKTELEDSSKLDSNKRMFTAVYRRLKPSRCRSNPEGDSSGMGPSTSNVGNNDEIQVPQECIRRARSIRVRSAPRDLTPSVGNFSFQESHDNSEDTSIDVAMASPSRVEDNSSEDWKLLPRSSTRLRSTRTKRSSSYTRDNSPPRKLNQNGRSSWLLLSAHEEGSRYIPQRGDDVVYLRQVDAYLYTGWHIY